MSDNKFDFKSNGYICQVPAYPYLVYFQDPANHSNGGTMPPELTSSYVTGTEFAHLRSKDVPNGSESTYVLERIMHSKPIPYYAMNTEFAYLWPDSGPNYPRDNEFTQTLNGYVRQIPVNFQLWAPELVYLWNPPPGEITDTYASPYIKSLYYKEIRGEFQRIINSTPTEFNAIETKNLTKRLVFQRIHQENKRPLR